MKFLWFVSKREHQQEVEALKERVRLRELDALGYHARYEQERLWRECEEQRSKILVKMLKFKVSKIEQALKLLSPLPRSRATCSHCQKNVELVGNLIGTHDHPVPTRQLCPGTGKPPEPFVLIKSSEPNVS